MAAKTTDSFGSAARLVICEHGGSILKVTFLKGLTLFFGIPLIVVYEAGFHIPRTRPLSPGLHKQKCALKITHPNINIIVFRKKNILSLLILSSKI